MKTLATIVVEVNWENKYEAVGDPDMETAIKEHIKGIENNFGYEWDLEEDVAYIEGDLKILEIKPVNIIEPNLKVLPFCEHCGEGHIEFGCEFSDGNTSWCLDCYLSDKPNSSHLYNYYSKLEKKAYVKYLKNKIKEVEGKA
jgi:hypothetical protein